MRINLQIASENVQTKFASNMMTANKYFLLILIVWVLTA